MAKIETWWKICESCNKILYLRYGKRRYMCGCDQYQSGKELTFEKYFNK